MTTDIPEPHDLLVSSRLRRLEGGEPPHRDPALTRVRRGYFRAAEAVLSPSQSHRLRIAATADARREGLLFSHASAAELWGCPSLNSDLAFVHVTSPGRARRTTAGVKVHRSAVPDDHVITLPSGLLVTSREWTAVELAASLPLPNVLLPLDHLLRSLAQEHGVDQAEVLKGLAQLVPERMKGRMRALRHLRLADARSGSAGESLSRGQMVLIGVPMPQLQVAFARPDGFGEDIVDFDWPELGTFGEFDGLAKYHDRELAAGRTPGEVLWEEKDREDRIRRHRPRGARWGWNDALSRTRLASILAAAGIHPVRKVSP